MPMCGKVPSNGQQNIPRDSARVISQTGAFGPWPSGSYTDLFSLPMHRDNPRQARSRR